MDKEIIRTKLRKKFVDTRRFFRRLNGRAKNLKFKNLFTKNFHQSYLIVFFCLGAVAGMITGLIFRINYFASPLFIVAAVILFLFGYFRPRYIFAIIMLLSGSITAFYRVATELEGAQFVTDLVGKTVTVEGQISTDPDTDESVTKIILTDLAFGDTKTTPVRASIYVTLSKTEVLERGDRVTLTGALSSGFGTYSATMYRPQITKLARASPKDPVIALRDWFADRIKSKIPEEESSLGLSYLLGMKINLSEDLEENLRAVGLTHIVVASGAHLAILASAAKKLFGKISKTASLVASLLFVVLFMALVGFTPSILRAGIMAILTIIASHTGRNYAPWRIILITATITLFLSPMYLISLGWLLSFLSYAGIMIIAPKLTKFFFGAKKPKFIASTIITTISATIMTLPVTLYYFGAVSLISVVANLLILPTLSIVMLLVFLTGVTTGLPIVETFTAFLAIKSLDFHLAVINFFGAMKSFLVEIPAGNANVFWLYLPVAILLLVGLLRTKMVKLNQVTISKKGAKNVRT